MGKDKIVYIRNDEELAEFVAANKGKKYQVQRFKGLGEMSAEETEETLTDPKTRVLNKVTVDDIKATDVYCSLDGNCGSKKEIYSRTLQRRQLMEFNQIELYNEMSQNFIEYAVAVNSDRAIP